MQMSPRPCLARKLTFSGVTKSAPKTRSPSFSRSSSSTRTTISPARIAWMTSATGLMAAVSRRISAFYSSLLFRSFRFAAHPLADARRFARASAQVIELGAAHIALALHFDRSDERRIGLEGALDALSRGHLAHDERGVEAAVALGDHHAFERLQALPLALHHVHVHHHRVAGREVRDLLLEALDLFLLQCPDEVHSPSSFVLAGIPPATCALPWSRSGLPAAPAGAATSCPAPASSASAGCFRGAPTAAPPARGAPREPPGACTAGNPAARRQTTPPPRRPRRRAPRAAAAPPRQSAPSPQFPHPRARSRRSRFPRRPAARAAFHPRLHIGRTARSGSLPSKTPEPCGDPTSCPAARGITLCRLPRFSQRRASSRSARPASPFPARRHKGGHPPSGTGRS